MTICIGLSTLTLIKEMRDIKTAIKTQTSNVTASIRCQGMRESLGQMDTYALLKLAKYNIEYKIGDSIFEISDVSLVDAKNSVNEIVSDMREVDSSNLGLKVTFIRGTNISMPKPLEMVEDLYDLTFLECHGK